MYIRQKLKLPANLSDLTCQVAKLRVSYDFIKFTLHVLQALIIYLCQLLQPIYNILFPMTFYCNFLCARVTHAAKAYEGCDRHFKPVFAEPKPPKLSLQDSLERYVPQQNNFGGTSIAANSMEHYNSYSKY